LSNGRKNTVGKLSIAAIQHAMKLGKKVEDNQSSSSAKFKDVFSKLEGIGDWQRDVKGKFRCFNAYRINI
jgi:hypothetical protein